MTLMYPMINRLAICADQSKNGCTLAHRQSLPIIHGIAHRSLHIAETRMLEPQDERMTPNTGGTLTYVGMDLNDWKDTYRRVFPHASLSHV